MKRREFARVAREFLRNYAGLGRGQLRIRVYAIAVQGNYGRSRFTVKTEAHTYTGIVRARKDPNRYLVWIDTVQTK